MPDAPYRIGDAVDLADLRARGIRAAMHGGERQGGERHGAESALPLAPAAGDKTPAAEALPQAADAAATAGYRRRIRFSKLGDLRLISHRDLVRAFERMFRRADIEVRQSEGFHPKPRIMFPSALQLGIAGLDEVCEVDLAKPLEPAELFERLAPLCPPGLSICSVAVVPPGLRKARLKFLRYELPIAAERLADVVAGAARLMAAASWPVERPGRSAPVDLRSTLADLHVTEGVLHMSLLAIHEAQARPRDILAVLNLTEEETTGMLVRTRVELDAELPTGESLSFPAALSPRPASVRIMPPSGETGL